MKILLAASDLSPLLSPEARRLATAIPTLPAELHRAGHEVSVVGPLTPALEKNPNLKTRPTGVQISLPLGSERLSVEVREARSTQGVQMFLFKHDESFGCLEGWPTAMDARTAILFSKLIIELARRLNPAPNVVQIHDWPGCLAPVFLRAQHLPFASVIALGNPAEQGSFPIEDFGLLNLGWEYFRPTAVEFYGQINFLKAGLLYTDAIIVDGELDRHALQMPEFGGGLDMVFREQAHKLHGIPAGLDELTWNPASDALIPRKYRPAALAGKQTCRNVLLAQLGLTKNPEGPVFLIDRTAHQDAGLVKLLVERLDELLEDDVRLLALGNPPDGSPGEVAFEVAAKKHADKLALVREMDERMTHMTLAAGDFQLFFGRGRGLTATLLRGLRYGVLPIAPAGPGMRQIIDDYQPGTDKGHGLIFYKPTDAALFDTLAHRAPALLEPEDHWEGLRQRAMIHAGKYGWSRAAVQYVGLYERLRR
jgi:starch synthase